MTHEVVGGVSRQAPGHVSVLVHQSSPIAQPAAVSTGQSDADESDQESGASSSDTLVAEEGSGAHDHDAHDSVDDDKDIPVYTGVSRSGLNGRWRAQLSTRGRTVHLGTFASAEEAARAWDLAAVQERGKAAVTNFNLAEYINSDGSLKSDAGCASSGVKAQGREDVCPARGHKSFRGVYHSGTYGRWKARIVVKGHKIHLGTFASAEDAARAWDLKALEYRGAGTVTNFDAAMYANGKIAAPREIEAASDSEEGTDKSATHEVDRAADRKRSRAADSDSPSPSELSNLSTPRDVTYPTTKRAHLSPKANKAKPQWDCFGQKEEEEARCSSKESMAMASLLSLCAAAEAMS